MRGGPELLHRITEVPSLRLHAFGHIHGAPGMSDQSDVLFANVALMGHLVGLVHRPLVLRPKPNPD